MQVICPKCRQVIQGDDLNIATDVARCRKCDEVFELSSLVQASASGPLDLANPPRGAWYEAEFNGFDVGATTRNAGAFFLVPFMCVWSGFSLGGIYGMQIVNGEFNLYHSLFGIPFILGTMLFGSLALMSVCGHVNVRVRDDDGLIFTGIGFIGRRQTFNVQDVTGVRIEQSGHSDNANSMTIVLEGPKKLRFGGLLTEARRDFVANVLRQHVANRQEPRRGGGH